VKRSGAFIRKGIRRCSCCGEALQDKLQRRVDNVILCDGCNYTLHERGYLHIDEAKGVHTFWLLKDSHMKRVTLGPAQYAEFCKDPNYLTAM
jgi:hypothetical protein